MPATSELHRIPEVQYAGSDSSLLDVGSDCGGRWLKIAL